MNTFDQQARQRYFLRLIKERTEGIKQLRLERSELIAHALCAKVPIKKIRNAIRVKDKPQADQEEHLFIEEQE